MEGDLRRLLGPAPARPDRQPGTDLTPSFDDVRAICLALPEAEEVLTWGSDVTFRVNGKIFAIGGEGADSVSIKATPEVQADLIALDGRTFSKSAYTGRFGWTTVRLDRVAEAHLRELLTAGWRRTAPRRLIG